VAARAEQKDIIETLKSDEDDEESMEVDSDENFMPGISCLELTVYNTVQKMTI